MGGLLCSGACRGLWGRGLVVVCKGRLDVEWWL